ncbi:hypothetical protein HJFPF1_12401 [Paramyrothecium foliicola]|nr:hypothetical protein HJFPF1_12401 [Paramyrothecium foliicola]
MDWSRLESLELQEVVSKHVADVVPSQLTSLNHLTIVNWNSVETFLPVSRFITAVPSGLKSLVWHNSWRGENKFGEIFDKHGPTLDSVEIRSSEGRFARPILSKGELKMIGTKAPTLQSISINLHRNGTWPWDTLEVLASSLKSVKRAKLWLELASDCQRGVSKYDYDWEVGEEGVACREHRLRQPQLNATSATEVFEFLRVKNGDGNLRQVTFYAGDLDRLYDPSIWEPDWVEGKKVRLFAMFWLALESTPMFIEVHPV